MESEERPTAFVTEATGFVGAELVKVLVERGHRVLGLAPSLDAAEQLRRAGAVPIIGDMLEQGRWQDEAAADWVFQLSSHDIHGSRMTRRRAASISRARLLMDSRLLDTVAGGATRRIVYVADACCYGPVGPRPVTEDEPPQPSSWGRHFMPVLHRLDGYGVAGLPIVTAFPGWVYGNASWFRERVVNRVMSGRHVLQCGQTGPWVSPIHVHDCARALVHLAEHGAAGGRYFVVNSEPVRLHEFSAAFSRLANRPLHVWRLPALAARLLAGPILADLIQADAAFANIRLRGTGFRFRYPTLELGLQQILGVLHE
jgi:nucleoside-diphosphate-sugar epimerase